MRHLAALLVAALLACGGEAGATEREELAGEWTLVAINGVPLPATSTYQFDDGCDLTVTAGRLFLSSGAVGTNLRTTATKAAKPGQACSFPDTYNDVHEGGWSVEVTHSATTCEVAAVPRNWHPPPGDAHARHPASAAS